MNLITTDPFSVMTPAQERFSFGSVGLAQMNENILRAAEQNGLRADSTGTLAISDEQLTTYMQEVLLRPPQEDRGRQLFRITDGGLPPVESSWRREIVTTTGRARWGFTGKGKNTQAPTFQSAFESGRTMAVISGADWNQGELDRRAAAAAMRRAGPFDIIANKIAAARDMIYQDISHGNLFGPQDEYGQPISDMYGLLNFPTIPRVLVSGTAHTKTGIELANIVFDLFKAILEANVNAKGFRPTARYNVHTSVRVYDLLMRTATSTTYPTMSAWQWLKQNQTMNLGECMYEFWCKDDGDRGTDIIALIPDKASAKDIIFSLEVGGLQQSPIEVKKFEYSMDMYQIAGGLDCKRPREVCIGEVAW